jgi:alcohol dehydrogenase class IV
MHTPVEVTDMAMAQGAQDKIDGVVSVGGGSTIGLGKAIAWRTNLPQIALPTTYAGSEMTPILGETAQGTKVTRRSPRIQPETVIYDVDLTLTLPVAASVTSGLNAIAHAVEALYALDGNPITALIAEEGIRAMVRALPALAQDGANPTAREDGLYGAWLCGTCLGQVGMALHHKLCHTLGGSFNLPHAETHSVILPHAVAYNQRAAPAAMGRLAGALGVSSEPALALHRLAARLGAPLALRDIGLPEAGIARAADLASANPYPNPRPIERAALEDLLRRAWAGQEPVP